MPTFIRSDVQTNAFSTHTLAANEGERRKAGRRDESSGIAFLFYSLYLPRPSTHRHTYHARHYLSYPSCVSELWLTTDVFRQRERERQEIKGKKVFITGMVLLKDDYLDSQDYPNTHTYQQTISRLSSVLGSSPVEDSIEYVDIDRFAWALSSNVLRIQINRAVFSLSVSLSSEKIGFD